MHSSRRFQCNTFYASSRNQPSRERGHPHFEAQPASLCRCSTPGADRNADSSLMSRRSGNRVGARSYPAERTANVPSEKVAPLLIRPCQGIEETVGGPIRADRRSGFTDFRPSWLDAHNSRYPECLVFPAKNQIFLALGNDQEYSLRYLTWMLATVP